MTTKEVTMGVETPVVVILVEELNLQSRKTQTPLSDILRQVE